MQDAPNMFDEPLAGLSLADWVIRLAEITQEHGAFEQLDEDHFAASIEKDDSKTLIVTFETIQGIRALDEAAQPLGWEMVKSTNWSHIAFVSRGDTWFRSEAMYDYIDLLIDDGYFDAYENVLFYGAGPCGYAAAAFSVAAPGATVVAVQPQATLDPEVTEWDERFYEDRRRDFTSRYGYAPDMVDAAAQAFVIYDPAVSLDAMHAALFTRPNVTKLPSRHMGATVQTHLMEMGVLHTLLTLAGAGKLSRLSFAKAMRARRDYPPYLRNLLTRLDLEERTDLIEVLCKNVTRRMRAPKFARRLRELEPSEG